MKKLLTLLLFVPFFVDAQFNQIRVSKSASKEDTIPAGSAVIGWILAWEGNNVKPAWVAPPVVPNDSTNVAGVDLIKSISGLVGTFKADTSASSLKLATRNYVTRTITSNSWGLTGNSGTTAGTNFIGTTDNNGLSFRTNNITKVHFDSNGYNTFYGFINLKNTSSTAPINNNPSLLIENTVSWLNINYDGGARDLTHLNTADTLTKYNSYDASTSILGSYDDATGHLSGFQFRDTVGNTGYLGSLRGYSSNPYIASGSKVISLYHYYIPSDWLGTGTCYTQYGLYIPNLLKATTNYSIYTGTAQCYFGGEIGVHGAFDTYNILRTNTSMQYYTNNSTTPRLTIWSDSTTKNTLLGYYGMTLSATGTANTAVGNYSLHGLTSGINNTASGSLSMNGTTSGGRNTASGWASLYSNTTGGNNTGIGLAALYSNTTGNGSTALGEYAGELNTGTHNSFIFDSAGINHTSGTGCGFIGVNTTGSAATNSNEWVIGNAAVGNGSNTTTIGTAGSTTNVFLNGALNVPYDTSLIGAGTKTVATGKTSLILQNAVGGTTITINFPSSAKAGDIFVISTKSTFTTPTLASSGNTFDSAPAALTAHTGYRFQLIGTVWYNLSLNIWEAIMLISILPSILFYVKMQKEFSKHEE